MNNIAHKTMRDSVVLRWSALFLVALMMFFGYMFVDVLSPLQSMLEHQKHWTPEVYGIFTSSEYFLNVFVFFLLFAGIILDKLGIRVTFITSGIVMIVGAAIKWYAISNNFHEGQVIYDFLNSFITSFPADAKLAAIGFAIFGCGIEMAGITVSKAIVKWFNGKEMALAMGVEMALARLGVWAVFRLSPYVAELGTPDVVRPVAMCCLLLLIGFFSFLIYCLMDKKLDSQDSSLVVEEKKELDEEVFKISDIGKLFTNKVYLIVAGLCVIYYSAIFPFQKYATNMLENSLGLETRAASNLFSWFPIGAMFLTPILGLFLDKIGKGATMLIIGSILMFCCHLTFAIYPFEYGSLSSLYVAYIAIVLLGISFSLVPAALWPAIPKLVDQRYLGSAYGVVFWIQNFGLWVFPIIIGLVLQATNPAEVLTANNGVYNYTPAMLVFASLGILAGILGVWLLFEDKRHHYGLEDPNIKD